MRGRARCADRDRRAAPHDHHCAPRAFRPGPALAADRATQSGPGPVQRSIRSRPAGAWAINIVIASWPSLETIQERDRDLWSAHPIARAWPERTLRLERLHRGAGCQLEGEMPGAATGRALEEIAKADLAPH